MLFNLVMYYMKTKNTYSSQLFWWLISYNISQFILWVMNAKCKWASDYMKELNLTINYITKFLLTPSMLSESLGSSSFKQRRRGERKLSAFVTSSNCHHRLLSDYHGGDSYPEREKSAVRTIMKDFYCWCFSLYFPDMLVTLCKFLSI